MPLNPVLKALLEQMQAQPTPPMWQMQPEMARAVMQATMPLIAAQGEPIGKSETISIPTERGEIAARVYSPVASGSAALPALIYYHGGGWVIGDLDTHDELCRILANESGMRVISVDYHLAPEHKYPAAVDDTLAALAYVEANAASLGVDPNALAVGGDSAGGALAAIVAQEVARNGGPKLAYQLLLFPVTQIGEDTPSLLANAEGYFLERATLHWFYNHYLPDGVDRRAPRISPLHAEELPAPPPAYVMLAGFDPLHDEGLAYAQKLRAAGAEVTIDDYPDMIHVFVYMTGVIPQARAALAKAAGAMKTALNPE